MAKNYKGKSNEEKEKEVNDLLDKAEKGIESVFDSQEDIKSLGDFISKFYNYSIRNTLLIQKQFQGALAVGSYAFWKAKGFLVNKGEKGIKILAPNKRSEYFINENGESISIKKATEKEKELIKKGELEVLTGKLSFSQGYVFDVSQTNAKADDLPKIFPNRWLEGDVENYDLMYKAMENIAKSIGVKIIDPPYELGTSKGASYPLTKEIALNPRNNQLQNVKTLIHELAHAKLHTIDKQDEYTKSAKEFQAELTAYTVCKYFGLDTEEYSFRYINEWTKDIELKDKEKLLNEVKETIHEYIAVIEDTLINEKELSLEKDKNISLEENINKDYDKSLYEIKEEEVMNSNSIKDIFKSLKEKVMIKVNFILGKENEEFDIEQELREFEELFLEAEDSMEMEDIKESMIFRIDGIDLEVFMENGIEEEKLLKLKDDLIELYEREISEEYKTFMKKRGLELDGFIESFKERLEGIDFEEGTYDMSFKDYLEEELIGYSETEYEEFEEETYMDRLERQQIGEEEYIKTYGKNNFIDTYMYYYERAYISYENLDKDKIYTIKGDIEVKDIEIKEGEEFKISGYNQGKFIIEFPNRDIKTEITFNELQDLSDLLKKEIEDIVDLERYFNEKNLDKELRRELHQNKDFIHLLDEKREIDITIRNLKEDIEYYSEDNEYSIDDLKVKLNKYESLSLDKTKELNRIVSYKVEEVKEEELNNLIESDDWKLTDRDLDNVNFKVMKNNIEEMMKENYGDFIRGIISIETGIEDLDLLDSIYEKYMDNDFNLINDNFEDLKNDLLNYSNYDKEKEKENESYLDNQFQENNEEKNYYDENVLKIKIAKVLEEKVYSGVPINEIERETKKFLDNTADVEKINLMIKEKGFKESIEHVSEVFLFLGAVDNYNAFIIGEKEIMKDSAIKKAREELKNEKGLGYKHNRNRTVEVLYSEMPGFKKGEKLTIKEAMAIFKEEVEFGAEDKAVEFKFSLNENIKYNEEFIIDKGSSVDLLEHIEEKIEDNYALRELMTDYLKNNGLEFMNKGIEKELNKEKEKEMELE